MSQSVVSRADERLLEGKVVVITGAGRGLGRAHAMACAAAGARVVVNDLGCDLEGKGADPSVAAAVVDAILEQGGEAIGSAVDVGGSAGVSQLFAQATEAYGAVHAVIGAAGLSVQRSVLKMEDDVLARILDVHVKGSFALVRAGARAMLDAGEPGSIVLHTGPVAMFGAARQSAMAAASAAVVGLVRSSAIELRRHPIRVNAIAPTARTRATEHLPLFQGIADGSMGPERVAPVGVFLASSKAAEVSGEVIGVAGSRLYLLQSRETPGWFGEAEAKEPPTAADIAAHWADLARA